MKLINNNKTLSKHYIILGIAAIIAGVLFFHLFTYYKVHGMYSERAIAGLIIVFVITFQRFFAFLNDYRLFKLIGNPLENGETVSLGQRTDKLFSELRKAKGNFINANYKKFFDKTLLSKEEKKHLMESYINSFANILTICAVAGVVIYFKKLVISFGVIGVGIAMFTGVICAAYFTRNLKYIINIRTKKKETLFTRGYLNNSQTAENSIFFFNDWHFGKYIELCLVYSHDKKLVSANFVFMSKHFLEIKNDALTCGVYEHIDDFFIYEPVSKRMIEKSLDFVRENNISLEDNLQKVLNRKLKQTI